MNIQELSTVLDRHGSNLSKWSDQQLSQRVQEFAQENEDAQQLLAHCQYVDRLSEKALFVPDSPNIKAKVLHRISTIRQIPYDWIRYLSNWVFKPALVVLPLVIGFVVGSSDNQALLLVEEELNTERFEDPVNFLAIADD